MSGSGGGHGAERKKDKSKVKELTERMEALENKHASDWSKFIEIFNALHERIDKLEEEK